MFYHGRLQVTDPDVDVRTGTAANSMDDHLATMKDGRKTNKATITDW